jgi:basic membrane lipoprotein Med (substrate-binding protein (PBP1-ABC) superfamily)
MRSEEKDMRIRSRGVLVLAAVIACFVPLSAAAAPGPKVCVFVPGVVSGSPIYEQLVAGAKRAVAETGGASIKVVEGGFNQADWLGAIKDLAASGEFALIVSSNPSIPELCKDVALSFPKARFFIADGWLPGQSSIHTVLYNQLEQGYIIGYLAGLLGPSGAGGTKASHKAGLVIAQNYPSMDKMIAPGFEKGLKAADPEASLETRVIGNWYDATKASDLASSLFDAGVNAVLPIAGGAGQGVLSAAKARGRFALWFDGNGYGLAPGTIVGCAVLRQEKLVYERVKALLEGQTSLYGRADIVDMRAGYVDFDDSGAAYKALPAALRSQFEAMLARLRSGAVAFPVSGL